MVKVTYRPSIAEQRQRACSPSAQCRRAGRSSGCMCRPAGPAASSERMGIENPIGAS